VAPFSRPALLIPIAISATASAINIHSDNVGVVGATSSFPIVPTAVGDRGVHGMQVIPRDGGVSRRAQERGWEHWTLFEVFLDRGDRRL
jgi:hypothetical protein